MAEVENLEGDGSSLVREDLLDPELVCWVRTTRQIMMDISKKSLILSLKSTVHVQHVHECACTTVHLHSVHVHNYNFSFY